jgi:hypothetical protein
MTLQHVAQLSPAQLQLLLSRAGSGGRGVNLCPVMPLGMCRIRRTSADATYPSQGFWGPRARAYVPGQARVAVAHHARSR